MDPFNGSYFAQGLHAPSKLRQGTALFKATYYYLAVSEIRIFHYAESIFVPFRLFQTVVDYLGIKLAY